MTSTVDGQQQNATSYSSPLVAYKVDYSVEGCATSAVGMLGFVVGEMNSTLVSLQYEDQENLQCAQAMMCPIQQQVSDSCPTSKSFSIDVDDITGDITIPGLGLVGPDVCTESASIPGCYYNYQTVEYLKENPGILSNSNIDDLQLMQSYIYTMYYNDSDCADLVSFFTSNSGTVKYLPTVMKDDSLPCEVGTTCAVDPNSSICQEIRDGENMTITFRLETRRDEVTGDIEVYECDSSNEDSGQDPCFLSVPTDCIESTLYANCYFRHVSGPRLAQNPEFFVAGAGVSLATEAVSSAPTESPSDVTSAPSGTFETDRVSLMQKSILLTTLLAAVYT
jgi:hypothetical protein